MREPTKRSGNVRFFSSLIKRGVAYLDDGTMVVVEGARCFLNKTIDIAVTSVHQTTAER